jgi:hypothetical protein
LEHPRSSYLEPTSSSSLLREAMSSVWGQYEYAFKLNTMLNMSSSGTGAVNSIISVNSLASNSQFASLATVFNEFFVEAMDLHWMPVSKYNGPLSFTNTTMVANLPLGVTSLQHTQPTYTSLQNMSNSYYFKYHNTGEQFSHTWRNVEKHDSPVVGTEDGTGPQQQCWATVASVAGYTGTVQFISQPAPPALPVSAVLGTFYVTYHIRFRIRD